MFSILSSTSHRANLSLHLSVNLSCARIHTREGAIVNILPVWSSTFMFWLNGNNFGINDSCLIQIFARSLSMRCCDPPIRTRRSVVPNQLFDLNRYAEADESMATELLVYTFIQRLNFQARYPLIYA